MSAGGPFQTTPNAVGSARSEGALRTRRILFVDDEPDVLYSYKRLLERNIPDVNVITADGGPEALRILETQSVDVVVADYRMPLMDGIQLLYEIKRVHPAVPRILFTAYAEPELARRAAEDAAVDAFLSKDSPPERLVEVVWIYLGRSLQELLKAR